MARAGGATRITLRPFETRPVVATLSGQRLQAASHARHHGGTNSMERDEVFVPMREAEAPLMNFSWGYSLPVRLFYMVVTFTAGGVAPCGTNRSAGHHSDQHYPADTTDHACRHGDSDRGCE